jgi:hypothetical protein
VELRLISSVYPLRSMGIMRLSGHQVMMMLVVVQGPLIYSYVVEQVGHNNIILRLEQMHKQAINSVFQFQFQVIL